MKSSRLINTVMIADDEELSSVKAQNISQESKHTFLPTFHAKTAPVSKTIDNLNSSQAPNFRAEQLELENKRLLEIISELQEKQKADKTFMFMVVHDLKHPVDAILSQVEK